MTTDSSSSLRSQAFVSNHNVSGVRSRWWLKRGLWALIVAFIFVPFSLRVLPEFIQHFAHTYRGELNKLYLLLYGTVNPEATY